MKKASLILVIFTLVFAAFTGGIFLGKNYFGAPISVSGKPAQETQPSATSASTEPEQVFAQLIDINTADVQQLSTLPGIGQVIAQRIVDYREAHGPFTSVAQLNDVEGIGDKKLEELLDLICVGGST